MSVTPSSVSVVIPNWNGRRWLAGCLGSLARQAPAPLEVIVVDNGSTDGSLEELNRDHPEVKILALGRNTGFAFAANRGIEVARANIVALLNTDVVVEDRWLRRMSTAIAAHPQAASIACKMVSLDEPERLYDAGDILRRDGVCEQRGRFMLDDGRFDEPVEVFGACAGAALYRRDAVLSVGGFDERYFAYLEDVDLALRLRLAGWTCRYQPAVAYHAGEGSSDQLAGGHLRLVERNTLVLVAKAFPVRWLPLVLYRQLGWAWHALRHGDLESHLRGAAEALPMLPSALRTRRELRAARVTVEEAVPRRPIRGPNAGGRRSQFSGRTGARSELTAERVSSRPDTRSD